MAQTMETAILKKLDILVKLSAIKVTEGKNLNEQVKMLSQIGLQPKEIADMIGKTANNVSVALNYLKKASKKKK